MANVKKYNRQIARMILRHNSRLPEHYSNEDVDLSLSKNNFIFIDKGLRGYQDRLSCVKVLNRKNINTLCEWVITLPKELNSLSEKKQNEIMQHVSDFCQNRYGSENAIQSILHKDEKGQPHLHFTFVPIKDGARLTAKEVIDRTEMRKFHPDLVAYLNKFYPLARYGRFFNTGITKANGQNLTVEQLKTLERATDSKNMENELKKANNALLDYQKEKEHAVSLERENYILKNKVSMLNRQIAQLQEKIKTFEQTMPAQEKSHTKTFEEEIEF